jgi:hypothetical protein
VCSSDLVDSSAYGSIGSAFWSAPDPFFLMDDDSFWGLDLLVTDYGQVQSSVA